MRIGVVVVKGVALRVVYGKPYAESDITNSVQLSLLNYSLALCVLGNRTRVSLSPTQNSSIAFWIDFVYYMVDSIHRTAILEQSWMALLC